MRDTLDRPIQDARLLRLQARRLRQHLTDKPYLSSDVREAITAGAAALEQVADAIEAAHAETPSR